MTDLQIAVDMPAPQTHERTARAASGWPLLVLALFGLLSPFALVPIGAVLAAGGSGGAGAALIAAGVLLLLAAVVVFTGLTAVAPGEARVIQLLGRYVGTVRTPGLRFVAPFTQKRRVSTRIRNHETDITKVNDADGNPIEMAAVVVWQVEDTAKAVFEVDDFMEFVAFQTETAVRHIAGSYPYDGHDDMLSLRQNAEEITGRLSAEIQARVASAGVEVIESRITRLAYAPEIAQAMLRRQQAGAVVAARQRIVDGAVGMVEAALARLDEHNVIELDEERKATMVSNLLVVLCGDRDVQPVVNTGSLYH
ncbi:SPFH domain-containing protein [Microbispora rosea]|uniref:SPFH domain-containing protein n=1 Tax=Microbispora rosea TaxID=58117 RepID=UPI0037BB251C